MTERKVSVTLTIDTGPFVEAMRKAAAAVSKFAQTPLYRHLAHQRRHHRRENPRASAMHAAYDRRRRARRKRK